MRVKPPSSVKPASPFHPRNAHQGRYDFAALTRACPALKPLIRTTPHGEASIDFADAHAVRLLNSALLKSAYHIEHWDIPEGYLCPPIPGRADYLHCLADLLAADNGGVIPQGSRIRALDIGVGANCVYPLIGHASYGWRFVGSDIDLAALDNAQRILNANGALAQAVKLRRQASRDAIFHNVIRSDDHFDLTLCNPPFHASQVQATLGSQRKWQNLGRARSGAPTLNFGGHSAELCCPGGELAFIRHMISESAQVAASCLWFSTLVSKSANLPAVYHALQQAGIQERQTIGMSQGQKQSRLVAWSFHNTQARQEWRQRYWQTGAI
jgi:23S rRNA (adenine1618-N6)-methyltransferase